MKRLFILILIVFEAFSVVSCDFSNLTTTTNNSTTTTQNTTNEVISSETTALTVTTTEAVTSTKVTTTEQITTLPITTTKQQTTTEAVLTEPFVPTGYSLLQDELDTIGIPSIGSPKVLVFAIDFADYPSSTANLPLNSLDKAFNGTSSDLTYESLNSYYLKSSYGKLDLTADIYGYYRAEHLSTYYEEEYEKLWAVDPVTGEWMYDDVTYPDSDLINEVLSYYDDVIDYTNYDSNQDGYIDGVYLIYTHPVAYTSDYSDFWWAYQDQDAYNSFSYDNVKPNYFVWAGSEFFHEGLDNINARTIIHETGHMMGLDDYYDYYDNDQYHNTGGLGGADMMDSAKGDHNPFSKILLGWINPIVVEGNADVDITPFIENGDVVLLTDHWNGTIFDEYLLISYYTPTGLNEADQYSLFSVPGIIIYHISAEIDNGYNSDNYYTIFNNNETDSHYKLIKIIEADMDNYILSASKAENEDLFEAGDILGGNIYPYYKWYDGTYLGYNITISYLDESFVSLEIRTDN